MIRQQASRSPRGQAQLGGVDVHGAKREKAERGLRARDSVHDFVHRAVASGRDDAGESFRDRVAGEGFRFARTLGKIQRGAARKSLHAHLQAVSALAARGGVEDDGDAFHDGSGAAFGLFFKLSQRNVPA